MRGESGRARVVQMVRAGVDPEDIRYCWRPDGRLDTDGLPLQPCATTLWWTDRDQRSLDKDVLMLTGWTNNHPALKAAYDAKEAFFGLYDCTSRAEAERYYGAWENTVNGSISHSCPVLTRA